MGLGRTFRGILLGLCILPVAAEADVYLSKGPDGNYIISNVKRAGRHIQRVYHEPLPPPSMPVSALALAGADEKSMMASGRPYAEEVARAASNNDLPEALLHAVIRSESGYNPSALSVKGAAGLMQLMPGTARDMGVANVWDPASNIQGGARYLKQLMVMFGNDVSLAVAAYNAGPAAVSKRGNAIPPFAETRRYVPTVLRDYRRLLGDASPILTN
jgi:hypothetical protein